MAFDDYWKILSHRQAFYKERIPSILGFVSKTKMDDTLELLSERTGHASSILDIGSGDNLVKTMLIKSGYQGLYHTMDIDKKFPHDFHTLDEITGNYDFIFLFEVIEHLPLDKAIQTLQFAHNHLNPGGSIVISTPNANHINIVWKSDYTHINAFPLRDLYALFKAEGYKVDMFRIHVIEESYGVLRWIRRRLAQFLAWILYAEIEEGVFVFARKESLHG